MQRDIIITDLTRFKPGNPDVCIAGIDRATGACIRPQPYLKASYCQALNILPGGILRGIFTPSFGVSAPHIEDSAFSGLTFAGVATGADFKNVLDGSSYSSVESGFGVSVPEPKSIPVSLTPVRSIITLKVDPASIRIVEDSFNEGRIKLCFVDPSGREFRFLPITDLGFYDYAMKHHQAGDLLKLNRWISAQDEAYLRLGLGRPFKDQYWIQVNGIYTFPEAVAGIRAYQS